MRKSHAAILLVGTWFAVFVVMLVVSSVMGMPNLLIAAGAASIIVLGMACPVIDDVVKGG
jgi:hypothetical protein